MVSQRPRAEALVQALLERLDEGILLIEADGSRGYEPDSWLRLLCSLSRRRSGHL